MTASLELGYVTSSVDQEDRETRKYNGGEKHTLAQETARCERQEHAEDTDSA